MAETVFVLGAGASADAGAPVVSDFLEQAEALLDSDQLPGEDDRAKFGLVFKRLGQLQGIQSKAFLDLNNIEVLFNMVEMAQLIKRMGDLTETEIGAFAAAIRRVIIRTLELRVKFRCDDKKTYPTKSYSHFADLIAKVLHQDRGERIAVLTFNYDIALDFALREKGLRIDYCLDSDRTANGLPLLKLHGSLNWARCSNCEAIVPLDVHDYANRKDLFEGRLPEVRECSLPFTEYLATLRHKECKGTMQPEPVIVPPTWNKTRYQAQLSSVWHSAAGALGDAKKIIVIGYSIPDTDVFFHYLIALGMFSLKRLKKFVVINKDPNVEPRYQNLLSRSSRSRFEFRATAFSESIGDLRQDLGIKRQGLRLRAESIGVSRRRPRGE